MTRNAITAIRLVTLPVIADLGTFLPLTFSEKDLMIEVVGEEVERGIVGERDRGVEVLDQAPKEEVEEEEAMREREEAQDPIATRRRGLSAQKREEITEETAGV